MFTLKFIIPKEERAVIKQLNVKEFEEDIAEVEGQIELNIADIKHGGIDEDSSFFNIYLICWFDRLNKCCEILKTSKYVAFRIPETDALWMEMKVLDGKICIQLSKLFRDIITCYVTDSPYEDFEYYDWKDVVIEKEEFVNEVKKVTKEFIDEICELNEQLLDTKVFTNLKSYI